MKVISGYMLAALAGKDSPTVADVKKITESVGIELSEEEVKSLEELVEEMAGKSVTEVMEEGLEKLKDVPMGGGGGGGAAPAAAAAGGAGPAAAAAAVEEEEEEEEEMAAAGGLFGDDGDDY